MSSSKKLGRPSFGKPTCHSKRKHFAKGLCRECYQKQYYKEYYARNRRMVNEKHRIAHAKDPKRHVKARRKWYRSKEGQLSTRKSQLRKYQMTPEDYDRMYKEQNGNCLICGRHWKPYKLGDGEKNRLTLFVDHDHITGKGRGLLCPKCNAALGWYETHAIRIKEYLESAKKKCENSTLEQHETTNQINLITKDSSLPKSKSDSLSTCTSTESSLMVN